ncbi:hypothetical protein ACQB60_23530 [Actinomycetota bacterium Odt1-20B]
MSRRKAPLSLAAAALTCWAPSVSSRTMWSSSASPTFGCSAGRLRRDQREGHAEADELARGVDGGGAAALGAREPGGGDPAVVAGEGGRLEETDTEAGTEEGTARIAKRKQPTRLRLPGAGAGGLGRGPVPGK